MPTAEACNNIDDNCDGTVDGFGTSCGIGNCASTGTCTAGFNDCTAGTPTAETCNNQDDDCNGVVDNGNPGGGAGCDTGQLGVCMAGTTTCVAGNLLCLQNVQSSPEVCDNLDNDCDGGVDNVAGTANPLPTTCGVGACASTGTCTGGVDSCNPGTPSPEICDGIDNDCNGLVDDGNPEGGAACNTGQPGVCDPGTTTCVGGSLQCVRNVNPSGEVCDNLDNNCNGSVDDGLGSTTCGLGACQVMVQNCVGGVPQTCTPGTPTAETCNNVDDDCNGVVDNGNPGGGAACSTGLLGVCDAGTETCQAGTLNCVQNVQPSAEICDNLDNDCDGTVDDTQGGCAFIITSPTNGAVLDCRPGAPRPTIAWAPAQYDRFKVQISWDPNFTGEMKVSSGDTLIKSNMFTLGLKKTRRACNHANPNLYLRVLGVDIDVPRADPDKRAFTPVVTVDTQK